MRGEFIDVSGARMYCYAAGTRGAGEPVVFIHGFPTNGHLWRGVVPLVPAGHRVLVLDLLGYGRSDRPQTRMLDINAHADRVLALLDQLGIESACIVGHHIGGGVAQSLAVRYPERVSRLCLIASVAFDQWPTITMQLARLTLPLTRNVPPALALYAMRRALLRGYMDPDRAAHSVDRYLRPFAGTDGRNALVQHLIALRHRETATLGDRLGEIRVPTAVVWGQHDPFLPVRLGQRLHHTISRSTFDVLPNVRHFTPEESPGRIADVLTSLLLH